MLDLLGQATRPSSPLLCLVLAFVGLLVGVGIEGLVSSFAHDRDLWPWPRCRKCGRRAPLLLLIPVVGALLSPACEECGQGRRGRLLQIEVATAITFYLVGVQYVLNGPLLALSLVEAALLLAILFIDLETRLIPTLLVIILVVLGLAGSPFWPGLGLWQALEGGALGFACFGLLVVLARVIFGEGALGVGDANLALAIGCITGYPLVAFTLSLGVFLGGIGAFLLILVARRGMKSTIPYGPYLVLGVLYVLVSGNTIHPFIHL